MEIAEPGWARFFIILGRDRSCGDFIYKFLGDIYNSDDISTILRGYLQYLLVFLQLSHFQNHTCFSDGTKDLRFPQGYTQLKWHNFSRFSSFSTLSTENSLFIHIINIKTRIIHIISNSCSLFLKNYPQILNQTTN